MFQLRLFKDGSYHVHEIAHDTLIEAVSEAKYEMRKYGATGARLAMADTPVIFIWEVGYCPDSALEGH